MAFSRRRDVGQAFRNNRQLQQFVLNGVTPTGRILGTGSFGSVEEVMYKRLICAGKRIHELLLNIENEGVPEMIQKYQQECQLMSSLRHPNITQFLGLCFLPGTQLPLLVMERLETSLDDLLECIPNLPLSLKRSILEDVAGGLLYLHEKTPPIIHRDLTSKNVLLTSSFVAKITDMGNSRIADMRPGQMARTLSKLPGTLVYMPPEARDDIHRYGPSLDVFSFGHLALFTITQEFPGDLLPSTFIDPDDPEKIQGRSEVECRAKYIALLEAEINSKYPALFALIKQCLHNNPDRRPTTDDLLVRLQEMRKEVEGEYGGPVKLDMVRVKLAKELKMKDKRIEDLTQQQQAHEAESAEKMRELEAKKRELEAKTRQLEVNNEILARKDQEMARKDWELVTKDEELARKDEVIASKDQQIAQQKGRVQQLQREMEELRSREARLREEMQSQETRPGKEASPEGEVKVPLKLPLQLKWRCGPDMPVAMSNYVQSVQAQGTVYVGGGLTLGGGSSEYTVMAYDTSSGKWARLPQYKVRYFAMAIINDQLVLVGGMSDNGYSKELGVWRTDTKKWTNPYRDMPTPRSGSSAVVYKHHWLIVAGGYQRSGVLTTVEVLNTSTQMWSTGPPTPVAWSRMKTAVVGGMCYFTGGSIDRFSCSNVYRMSISALISQLKSNSSAKKTELWEELPELPVTSTSPIAIGGSLLMVGGMDSNSKASGAVYLYQPSPSPQWVKVADMPTSRTDCTCVMTANGELLVTGGWANGRLANVDIAQIC